MSKNLSRAEREAAGRRAEKLAALYLRLKGYHILERRFRCNAGEIDIIALKKDTLVFVEVKQRATLTQAEESLTATGLNRVTAASETFYARRPELHRYGMRYDALFVIGRFKIIHRKGAWNSY